MSLVELQHLLQTIEPAAHLVEPIVLRRVVRLDRRLQGLRFFIPHDFCYTIDRDRLLAFVDLGELSLPSGSDLPRRVILLGQPDEDELQDPEQWPLLTSRYCRLLFHACIHLEIDRQLANHPQIDEWAETRRVALGAVEFAEIHDVLLKSNLLFQPPSDPETYVEFASLSLELKYFAPSERPIYFPAIRDWDRVDEILSEDVNHARIFERIRAVHGDFTETGSRRSTAATQIIKLPGLRRSTLSAAAFRQQQARAHAAAVLGNSVKSALISLRSARTAPPEHVQETLLSAEAELTRLALRLQSAFGISDAEAEQWREALHPLLEPATEGFWSTEARLLYDLQKVCSEQERGIYRVDLVDWIRTFGRRPIRRQLPLMQDALTLRHLRTAQRRILLSRISTAEQKKLTQLLEAVLPRIEDRSRDRMRKILFQVFDEVGFVPRHILEIVARRKIVEELLDRIVERSYFTLGDLRDTISKNDLKLEDVTSLSTLAFGDCVLRADRKLDVALDGIYRRGAIYLRWPQTLSSLVFGTNVGRILTRHVFIPFGGAYLLLEFIHHMGATISGEAQHHEQAIEAQVVEPESVQSIGVSAHEHVQTANDQPDLFLWGGVLLLGTWISLLIHRPEFRAWNVALLVNAWRSLRHAVVDLPSQLIHSESVQKILASRTFAVVRSYLLEPALLVSLIMVGVLLAGWDWDLRGVFELYLIVGLFLNSPVGRFISERTVDLLVRAWHEFKMHVFSAMLHWIVDLFDWLFVALERIVYTVDEWLRFRTGDDRTLRGVKLIGGVFWFFISYVVVFIFTLLVEPQINPLKHFPVVTVSHKLILPAFSMFVQKLIPYLGRERAIAVVGTVIWLIPGVFGFLVWELKENWRLYAANRPRKIGAEPIGHHGETMLRLLRPGFHSGTLPKSFATLRRFIRKGNPKDEGRAQRKRAGILHSEEAVKHFVERELIALLEEVGFLPGVRLEVRNVHAATNRIELILLRTDRPDAPARLTWEFLNGHLSAEIEPSGWIEELSREDQEMLTSGLRQLFQLSGAEWVDAPLPLAMSPQIEWNAAVEYWTEVKEENRGQAPAPDDSACQQAEHHA